MVKIYSTKNRKREITALSEEKRNGLQKIYKGIYVDPEGEPLERAVQKCWNEICSLVVPEGVLADLSAIKGEPVKSPGSSVVHVFMAAPKSRDLHKLPGLTISVREGPGKIDGDVMHINVPTSGLARRVLDNLVPSRAKSGVARTMNEKGIEAYLDSLCSRQGEAHLVRIRREAEIVAPLLGRERELVRLKEMIGGLLNTQKTVMLTQSGKARASGKPFDETFLLNFSILCNVLLEQADYVVPDMENTKASRDVGDFMEAYFSNYIEGTRFEFEEAVDVVLNGAPSANVKDGHDITATYEILQNQRYESVSSLSVSDFMGLLQDQHRILMRGRSEVNPGVFKDRNNRVGNFSFVPPDMVVGTMHKAWERFAEMRSPFAKGVALHYLISGVHPFNDGNGRMSRIFMNNEMKAGDLSRIIIPTLGRNDYLDGLKSLSVMHNPDVFTGYLKFFQRITASCASQTIDEALVIWASTYAFCEDDRKAKLMMPDPSRELVLKHGLLAPGDFWENNETELSLF